MYQATDTPTLWKRTKQHMAKCFNKKCLNLAKDTFILHKLTILNFEHLILLLISEKTEIHKITHLPTLQLFDFFFNNTLLV